MIYLFSILLIPIIFFFYKRTSPQISKTQRLILSILRYVYILIIAVFLLNPILYYFNKEKIKEKAILVIDDSESMNLSLNKIKKSEHYEQFKKNVIQQLKSEGIDYEVFNLSDYNTLKSQSSYFLPFLKELQKNEKTEHLQAVYLFSDGWLHDEDYSVLQGLSVPIHTFKLDDTNKNNDLSISDLFYNKTSYKSELTTIKANILSSDYTNEVKVQLIAENKIIQEKKLLVEGSNSYDIEFNVNFNKVSLIPFQVKIADVNDSYTENNIFNGAIQIVESKIKIALISDILNFDIRFISALIQNNERYSLELFTQKGNQLYQKDKVATIDLTQYASLILVNNGTLKISSAMNNVINQLSQESFGILIIGFPVQSLEEKSPVQVSNIRNIYKSTFSLSSEAEQYQIFESMKSSLLNIPPVSYYYVSKRNNAKVLAEINNESRSPFITYMSNLNSHVIHIAGFDLWKWKSSGFDKDYDLFFNGLIDWISRKNSENFYATSDKNSYYLGEKPLIQLSAFDETLNPLLNISPKITLKKNNSLVQSEYMLKSNNEFEFKFESLPEGNYTFEVTEDQKNLKTKGQFIIHAKNKELYDTGINSALLSMISNITHGSFLSQEDIHQIKRNKTEKTIEIHRKEIQLYKKIPIIFLFLLFVCSEYYLRKKWGLL